MKKFDAKSNVNKPAKNILDRMTNKWIGFHHNINHKAIWNTFHQNTWVNQQSKLKC